MMSQKKKRGKKLVVANWKMNPISVMEARKIFARARRAALGLRNVDTVVCPPAVYLSLFGKSIKKSFALGAQDSFYEVSGSHTSQISPAMLLSLDCSYVILGHSERRAEGETNEIVARKMNIALAQDLRPIVCVGERVRDDDAHYLEELRTQITLSLRGVQKKWLDRIVVAYEPVWAIGATASMDPSEIHGMTIFIKKTLGELFGKKEISGVRVLYGGSVNAENAGHIVREGMVDGLLVGRDSLTPDFSKILESVNRL